jgi:hypothetical protein
MRYTRLPVIVFALLASTRLGAQQSLAELARQEEERRKATPPPTKVYTNKDLGSAGSGTVSSAASPAATKPEAGKDPKDAKDPKDSKDSKDPKDAKDAKDSKDAKDAAGQDKPKDKAYWAARQKALQDTLDRDQSFAEALQSRINALTTEFVNRADPAQRTVVEQNRNKAIAELERLKKTIVDDKKALADFEEEARRAGVPPGWLR